MPPAKRANNNPFDTPVPTVDLINFDPIEIDDLETILPTTVASDGYSPVISPCDSLRSRTPPRSLGASVPIVFPPAPARIPDDAVQLCDVYGLMFSQASNQTTLLNHLNKVSNEVSNLCDSVETLKATTNEAQSAASIAISSVQALSTSVDSKFAALEHKFSNISLGPPAPIPTPSSLPRTKPAPSAGVDHIEAVVLGWPAFTRATIATPWLLAFLDRINDEDSSLSPIFRPIGGSFCKLGVFRFETYEDRRDFIAIAREKQDLLDFSNKGTVSKLYIKASVPKDVAKDTDILRSAVFKSHELLKSSSFESKEQLLTCYKTRTLTLFDTPIAFYIDSENLRLETREGGEFCIDRNVISQLGLEKYFTLDCNELVQFLSKKFPGRNIVDK